MKTPQNIGEVLEKLHGVKKVPDGWTADCPVVGHETPAGHLKIADAGDKVLVTCYGGQHTYEDICKALGYDSLTYPQEVAAYDYTDEKGNILYQVVRYEPKTFKQRRPVGDGWAWGLNGNRPVLYHLPEVIKAVKEGKPIYITEGEKDADNLRSLGLVATTNSGGAGKWRDEFSEYLKGAEVIIIPDNDEPGRKHADKIMYSLEGKAKVKLLELPEDVKDISDWLDIGGKLSELEEMVKNTEYLPPNNPPQVYNIYNNINNIYSPKDNDIDIDRDKTVTESVTKAGQDVTDFDLNEFSDTFLTLDPLSGNIERDKNVTKTVTRSVTLAQRIEDWVRKTSGWFDYTEIDRELNLSPNDRQNRRKILQRLKEAGVIESHRSNNKLLRYVNTSVRLIDFKRAGDRTPLEIYYPFEIEKLFNTYPGNLIVVAGASDSGKGHPNGTLILTDDGFRPIESLKLGDNLFSVDGKRTKLVGIYPRGEQDVYKFTFEGGASIEVDSEHLWSVQTQYQRKPKTSKGHPNKHYGEYEILSTKQIVDLLGLGRVNGQILSFPRNKMIENFGFKGQAKFPPYLLGILLGDGCLTGQGIRLSTADKEILDYCNKLGIETKYTGHNNYNLSLNSLSHRLPRGLKCHSYEKRIPRNYLLGVASVRKQLLRGLLDTDGWVENSNACFTSSSEQLALDVKFLAESLGGSATIRSKTPFYFYKGERKQGRKTFTVSMRFNDFCPFKLKRKADKWKPCKNPLNRILEKIEYVGRKPTTCLSVDDEKGLYIAQDFIVTHNTAFLLNFIAMNMDKYPIYYQSSEMGAEELANRLQQFDGIELDDWNFTAEERSHDWADVIRPDCINIIDYLEIEGGEYYLVNDYLRSIYDKLGSGIGIVALQKKRGSDLGRGGDFGLEKPRLYLSMDYGKLKIEKAKNWATDQNPNGLTLNFKLVRGCDFHIIRDWYKEEK